MIDEAAFNSVASQMMSGDHVKLQNTAFEVRRTRAQQLKCVRFTSGGKEYEAIEQNPDKPSRWGELARQGHHVVQFKDVESNRFVAVSVDGKTKAYGSLRKKSSH